MDPKARLVRYDATPLAWEAPPDGGGEVDGTWQVVATVGSGQRVVGFAQTRFTVGADGTVEPLEQRWAEDLVAGLPEDEVGPFVAAEWWYPHGPDGLPDTRAHRFSGDANELLDRVLALPSAYGMQDWPLEVSDPAKIDRAIALYEETDDDGVRFDVMRFVLFSAEGLDFDRQDVFDWIEATLARDLRIHGHTVVYWALLVYLLPDGSRDPDAGWEVLTPLARRVFDARVVPLRVTYPAK